MFRSLLLLLQLSLGSSIPYSLLINKAPKCFSIESSPNAIVRIQYDCPDLVKIQYDEKGEVVPPPDTEQYNERFQKRLETLKRAHLKDINIGITGRDAKGAMISSRQQPGGANLPSKAREQLEETTGEIFYETKDLYEGTIEVCIQSYTATTETPSRVGIRLEILNNDSSNTIEKMQKELEEKSRQLESETTVVKEQSSRITAELMRMHRRAKLVSGDAQYAKNREESFHQASIDLQKAVKFWPMLRILILFVTAYLQVSHVVDFMKKRHIY